jgi:outer membrane protein OmpA-like peptidoglycan-associated protein
MKTIRITLLAVLFVSFQGTFANAQSGWNRSYDHMHTVDITELIIDSLENNIFTELDSVGRRAVYRTLPGCDRWLKFTVPADTLLRFSIVPFDGRTDLDFILFKYNGTGFVNALAEQRVQHVRACLSQPGADITTGATYRATSISVKAGPGVAHVRPIQAKKGEIYYMLVQFGIVPSVRGYDRPPSDKRFKICFFDNCEPKKTAMHLLFDPGKSTLQSTSNHTLDSMLTVLHAMGDPVINIVGHTDDNGSDASNMRLSTERAKRVYDYFLFMGYPPGNMAYEGQGARNPVAFNDTEAGRAQNRRVEIQFLEQKK